MMEMLLRPSRVGMYTDDMIPYCMTWNESSKCYCIASLGPLCAIEVATLIEHMQGAVHEVRDFCLHVPS